MITKKSILCLQLLALGQKCHVMGKISQEEFCKTTGTKTIKLHHFLIATGEKF